MAFNYSNHMNEFEHYGNHREAKKHPSEMLAGILQDQSQRINKMLAQENFPGELLKPDATIDPDGYAELYDATALEADKKLVREREIEFSGAHNPNVQAFYKDEYGADTEEKILAQWRENKSREKNVQMEMAITALLSQKLGDEFLVVRTAPYDDYENGGDNLILDRVTREVVGAFDEVHEGGDGSRMEGKKEKIRTIAKNGGANIRYGLKLEKGKIGRAKLQGVPVFYLGLDSSTLMELVQALSDGDTVKTDAIFKTLLTSLEEQRAELGKYTRVPEFHRRLTAFRRSLSRLTQPTTAPAAAA